MYPMQRLRTFRGERNVSMLKAISTATIAVFMVANFIREPYFNRLAQVSDQIFNVLMIGDSDNGVLRKPFIRNLVDGSPTISPSARPSATNKKTITFIYAIEFVSTASSRNDAGTLIQEIERDIEEYLENIGYSSQFVSSEALSSNQQVEGSCLVVGSRSFCTLVEAVVEVSSLSRLVVAHEVKNFIQLYIERMNIFRGSNDIEATIINAIVAEFIYIYSTTDFNSPFFSFDSKIRRAVASEGYEVLSFTSMLDQFLGPGFMPRGAKCQADFVECTLNIGTISVAKRTSGSDESETLDLLRSISFFMENRNDDDITMVSYRSPELPELGIPSSEPSRSPIVTLAPTNTPTSKPTAVFKENINFIYALEYTYSGSPPDILLALIEGVKSQISIFLSNDGYNSRFVLSTPQESELPGSCNIDDPDSFCTLIDTVLEISSFSKAIDAMDVIYSIKPKIENLRLTDRRVGLDGRIKFVTEVEFTYLYSTIDLNFPFFSFDPVVATGVADQGVEILAFRSELIQFIGDSFSPKGSRCHDDYVECTLNKGILTVPLSARGQQDETEELVLRATKAFMMGRTNNDVSMVTYRTPEFNDPTATPSTAPSNAPIATNPPTSELKIQVNVQYALESSSPRLIQSLQSYLEPTIKHVNTEILSYLSNFVSVKGMTANLFKECKPFDITIFCSMISSDIEVKIDSRDSADTIDDLTRQSFSEFMDNKIIVASKLGVTVRLYQFFFFDFKYLVLQETTDITSYDKVDEQLKTFIVNDGALEVLTVEFEIESSRRRLQEEICVDKKAFCAFRNCVVSAFSQARDKNDDKVNFLMLVREFMIERNGAETQLIYSSPDLPRYTARPSSRPSLSPTNMPVMLFPSMEPSENPVMATARPTSSPTQAKRSASFGYRMEGNYLQDPIEEHLESTFCPECTFIVLTNNMIAQGITETLEGTSKIFGTQERVRAHDTPSLHPMVIKANTVFKDFCGIGCILFLCHVEVINVDPDMTKDAFDFEFLSATKAVFEDGEGIMIPGQSIDISFVGPFATSANVNINLVGTKSLPDMTESAKRTLEVATEGFLSILLLEEDIPCKIMKVECLDGFRSSDVSKGDAPEDLFEKSVPSFDEEDNRARLLSVEVKFMAFFTPTSNNENFTVIIQRLVEQNYNKYIKSLIATDNAYFKLLNEKVIVPDTIDDNVPDLDDETNVDDLLNSTEGSDGPSEESNPGEGETSDEAKSWGIPMIAIPISIVGAGFFVIVYHLRGKSQPYVEYDEMINAYGEFG